MNALLPWLAVAMLALTACGSSDDEGAGSGSEQAPVLRMPAESLSLTLAQAVGDAGTAEYQVDSAPARGGQIAGRVRFAGAFPADTLTRPTHDLSTCRSVPDAPIRGTPDGVVDAVVWLVGVTHGPADDAPRRVGLDFTDCAITPRLQRVPVGASLLVRSADAIDARLRFMHGNSVRALVSLGEAGAVVPVTSVFEQGGLLEVRDDRHPWVRGWIAVAPHPFVAISDAEGRFTFRGVPRGRYALVAWHERLGRVAMPVQVDAGVEVRVTVTLGDGR